MMYKTEKKFPILFTLVVLLLLGMVLFACETSNEQERQITNAFTPGKSTQDAMLLTQQAEDNQTQTDTAVITPGSQPETAPLPSDQPTMMITTTQGQPIIVTQTRAATQPNQPTNVSTATKKPANTATATTTPTQTATLTPSPTLQTGWAGEWTFFVGKGDGPYKSANGNVSLDGLTAESLFTLDGVTFSFIADLSENQLNLNGRYQWGETEGWLAWLMDSNQSQFRGTLDNVYAFCAARVGMPMPEPCGDYVPY